MKRLIYNTWDSIMNYEHNPLRHIPDLNTRHMVMQVLAWMWCIVFSMYFGSMWVFGITAIAHVFIICAVVITVATFETAKRKPTFFLKEGYHTPSRSRYMYYKGKRIKNDNTVSILVRQKEDIYGRMKLESLRERFGISGIRKITSGVVWNLSSNESNIRSNIHEILNTNIIHNPLSHECYKIN